MNVGQFLSDHKFAIVGGVGGLIAAYLLLRQKPDEGSGEFTMPVGVGSPFDGSLPAGYVDLNAYQDALDDATQAIIDAINGGGSGGGGTGTPTPVIEGPGFSPVTDPPGLAFEQYQPPPSPLGDEYGPNAMDPALTRYNSYDGGGNGYGGSGSPGEGTAGLSVDMAMASFSMGAYQEFALSALGIAVEEAGPLGLGNLGTPEFAQTLSDYASRVGLSLADIQSRVDAQISKDLQVHGSVALAQQQRQMNNLTMNYMKGMVGAIASDIDPAGGISNQGFTGTTEFGVVSSIATDLGIDLPGVNRGIVASSLDESSFGIGDRAGTLGATGENTGIGGDISGQGAGSSMSSTGKAGPDVPGATPETPNAIGSDQFGGSNYYGGGEHGGGNVGGGFGGGSSYGEYQGNDGRDPGSREGGMGGGGAAGFGGGEGGNTGASGGYG